MCCNATTFVLFVSVEIIMFAPLAVVSSRVTLARALQGRLQVPRVTVVLQAEYLPQPQ